MNDLISALANSLRSAHRSRRAYSSMLDVAAGNNALSQGQCALALQYFQRAIPTFIHLAESNPESAEPLADLMTANACLIDTLERFIATSATPEHRNLLELAEANLLQTQLAEKMSYKRTTAI